MKLLETALLEVDHHAIAEYMLVEYYQQAKEPLLYRLMMRNTENLSLHLSVVMALWSIEA